MIDGEYSTQGWNRFSYVHNNPIRYKDPTGHWPTVLSSLYDQAHEIAIDRVLGNICNKAALDIIKKEQKEIDAVGSEYQKDKNQFIHAMTGKGQNRTDAIKNAETFVQMGMRDARDRLQLAKSENDNKPIISSSGKSQFNPISKKEQMKMALESFSDVLHTMQDATSPSHRGFQQLTKLSDHFDRESKYPTGQTRRELEAATKWASDIFTGKEKIPQQFFDKDSGRLLIPGKYLRTTRQ